jgi:predicted benzoate:H+ symporter BenE
MSPQVGLVTAVGCFASAASAGLIAIWYERPAPRSDFRRRRNASVVAAIAELVLGLLWASAVGFAAGSWWMFAPAPVILAGVALLALRRPQRSFAEVLQSK